MSRIIILISIVLVVILLILSELVLGLGIGLKVRNFARDLIFISSPNKSSISCSWSGGRWSDYQGGSCYFPPKDQGKACYQNNDCEVACIVTDGEPWPYSQDSEGYYKGECGVYSVTKCYPEIPSKTKDSKDLRHSSCV